jgi:uncharacterized protein YnzC (UPF0291/DUF896 family)
MDRQKKIFDDYIKSFKESISKTLNKSMVIIVEDIKQQWIKDKRNKSINKIIDEDI